MSVIDMPPKEDTGWWRGKHGFQVGRVASFISSVSKGYFCVALASLVLHNITYNSCYNLIQQKAAVILRMLACFAC